MSPSEVGVTLGIVTIAGGIIGGILGGVLSDFFATRSWKGGRFNVLSIACAACIPLVILWVTVEDPYVSMGFLLTIHLVLGIGVASLPSVLQDIVPNQLRGQLIAVLYLFNGILGAGLGPISVALASDHLFDASLKHSLLAVQPTILGLALLLALLGRGAYDRSRASPDSGGPAHP